jgi:hypothetical protein
VLATFSVQAAGPEEKSEGLALAAFVPLDHAKAARRIEACHQGAVKAVFWRYFPMENQEYAHASDVVGNTGRWSKRSRN